MASNKKYDHNLVASYAKQELDQIIQVIISSDNPIMERVSVFEDNVVSYCSMYANLASFCSNHIDYFAEHPEYSEIVNKLRLCSDAYELLNGNDPLPPTTRREIMSTVDWAVLHKLVMGASSIRNATMYAQRQFSYGTVTKTPVAFLAIGDNTLQYNTEDIFQSLAKNPNTDPDSYYRGGVIALNNVAAVRKAILSEIKEALADSDAAPEDYLDVEQVALLNRASEYEAINKKTKGLNTPSLILMFGDIDPANPVIFYNNEDIQLKVSDKINDPYIYEGVTYVYGKKIHIYVDTQWASADGIKGAQIYA